MKVPYLIMSFKLLGALFSILIIGLLILYWVVPLNDFSISKKYNHSNFVTGETSEMQFYPNLRYAERNIEYEIENCPLERKNEMERAFEIIAEKSILSFFESSNPDIFVTCEDKVIESDDGFFIAGEGGPTNITQLGKYNLILRGDVLLLRDSDCAEPNIAIHELLHALGFIHSDNPNNIMYKYSRCDQEISSDIIEEINKVYAEESKADLIIEEASVNTHEKYLDLNFTIRNIGFQKTQNSKVKLFVNKKEIKNFDVDSLNPGHGRQIYLTNIFITTLSVDEIKLQIDYSWEEISKSNNFIVLN